jgi:hypothetical protein
MEGETYMKKEDVRPLIEEHLVLRKKIKNLQEELKKLENRYEEVGELLYTFRSKEFLHSVLLYLLEHSGEYDKDEHFDDLVETFIQRLKEDEHLGERKRFTPKHLLHLYDEKIE